MPANKQKYAPRAKERGDFDLGIAFIFRSMVCMSTHVNAPSNTPSGPRGKPCGTIENGKLVAMLHIWRNDLHEKIHRWFINYTMF